MARARLEQAGKQRAGSGLAGPPRNGDGADRIARRRQGKARPWWRPPRETRHLFRPRNEFDRELAEHRAPPVARRSLSGDRGRRTTPAVRRPIWSKRPDASRSKEAGGNQVEMRAAPTSVSVRDGTVKPGTRKHRHARSRRLEALRRPDLEARRGARSDATGTACVVSHRPASARSRLNHRSLAQSWESSVPGCRARRAEGGLSRAAVVISRQRHPASVIWRAPR